MSKKITKQFSRLRIVLIASFVVAFLFFGNYVLSVSAETKNAGPLVISYPGTGPLFSATNIAPGYSETKTLTVTNNGTIPHSFAIAVSGTLGELAQALHIQPYVLGSPVWDKTITEIATAPDSNIIVGTIAPGGTAIVELTAYLPTSAGNEYQGKTTLSFSFVVGNEESEPEVSILPTPSPSPGGIGGGGLAQGVGQALGASTAPSLSPSEAASPSDNPEGDVKGEEKGESTDNGLNWWWLLVVPIVGIITIIALPVNLTIAIIIPVVSGAISAVFGARSVGSLSPVIFWVILIIEVLLFLAIEFYRWWQQQNSDEDEDFEEEI